MTSEQQRDPEKSDKVDRASEDSFPASDPPSYSGITGDGHPRKKPADETPASTHTPRRGRT